MQGVESRKTVFVWGTLSTHFSVTLSGIFGRSYHLKYHFYRAMHFSAKRGIEIAYRLSVCLSVTIRYRDHIGWNASKIISRPNSLGPV